MENKKWFKINGVEKSEEEFASWVDDQAKKHPVVSAHHGKWKELMAWEAGEQFSIWDDRERELKPVSFVLRKAKIVINLLKPLVEVLDSKIAFLHSAVGIPNSGETKDLFGSQVATKLLGFNDYVNGFQNKLGRSKYDLLRTGNACLKWVWDSEYRETSVAPRKEGKADLTKETRERGELLCFNVPIFNVRPDPTALDPTEMRWIIELKELTEQELLRAYPDAKEFIGELSPGGDKYSGMNVNEDEKDKDEPTYIVKEYWEKPSSDYEKGRRLDFCEKRCLFSDDNPTPGADIPYFFLYYKKTPYSFWSLGPLHFVQDLQRFTNRLVSMAFEHVESWRPKMMVGKNALRNASAFTVDPFEILEVDFSKGEPRPITMPQLDSQVGALRDFFISSLDRVSNIHEVSYSRLPQYASRAPASLYQQMIEQESLKLDPMIGLANDTFINMDKLRLEIMDKHYSMPRKIKVVGQNRAATIAYYDKGDLNRNFDVRLEMGISINQSPSMQVKLITELWGQGILDESFKPKIIRMLNLGTGEYDLRDDIADTEKAIRENQSFIDKTYDKEFSKGGIFFYIHDDHNLHLEYHCGLIKTEEAMQWEEKELMALAEHINQHFQTTIALSQAMKPPLSAPGAGGPGGVPGAHQASAGDEGGGGAAPGPIPSEENATPAPGGGETQPQAQPEG